MSQADSTVRALSSSTEQVGSNQLWQYFPRIEDADVFYIAWLSQQFQKIPDAVTSVLLLKSPPDFVFAPVAVWPDPNIDLARLQAAAETAIAQKQGLVYRAEQEEGNRSTVQLSCPLEVNSLVEGVVVIELADRPGPELNRLLNQLQWDLGWLSSRKWQEQSARNQLMTARSALALDILAVAEEHELLEPACMAVANEIAIKLRCDRVAIGLAQKKAKIGARICLVPKKKLAGRGDGKRHGRGAGPECNRGLSTTALCAKKNNCCPQGVCRELEGQAPGVHRPDGQVHTSRGFNAGASQRRSFLRGVGQKR